MDTGLVHHSYIMGNVKQFKDIVLPDSLEMLLKAW